MTLSRALLVLLLAIAGTGAQAGEKTLSNFSPWEKPLPNSESDPLRHAIVEAWGALDRGDAAAAAASFDTILADPRLATQPDNWQRDVLAGAGTAALQLDRNDVALRHFRAATASPANTAYDWQHLVLLEYLDDRLEPAAQALHTLATRWPETARDTNKVLVGQLIYRLSASTAISGEMIEAMLQAGWTPDVGGESSVAYRLALAQVIAGRRDAARRTLEAVDDPDSLLMVRADLRFDGLYEVSDLRWDVGAAARRRVSDLRAEAILAPEQLEPVSALANAMLVVGDHEDLIAMVDEVKATLAQATAGKPPYRDAGEHLPWLLNTRSIALLRLGRFDEALAQLVEAASQPEYGQPNVSQVLNPGGAAVRDAAAGRGAFHPGTRRRDERLRPHGDDPRAAMRCDPEERPAGRRYRIGDLAQGIRRVSRRAAGRPAARGPAGRSRQGPDRLAGLDRPPWRSPGIGAGLPRRPEAARRVRTRRPSRATAGP
ncbi:hypothetical protein [Arenimonas daejeonensis]|uniref:hypothetical protein n=1 Tax=Arenimonas daejeonensis TaxID=370777 RepID=UPI0011BF1D02|nr:hypothetical protein [Arenimonas daejeonensis]